LLETLSALGLEPEVQEADVAALSGQTESGTLANVLAVIRGRERGGAVLVTSHYDTVPWSPGAADNGAAVGAALETARVLASGPRLERDVIFLFTDAEELGLGGARLFVERHPLAERVDFVLNFEARGSGGPSIMFETAGPRGWLIDQLAEVAPTPIASSLADEVYQRMPNDTDFSVFAQAGLGGYNFAFIEGLRHYHTPDDTVHNLDPRSVQHHGESMLALTRHLAVLPSGFEPPEAEDAVYFNLSGLAFVHYGQGWVWWLEALLVAVTAAAVGVALRRRRVRARDLAAGWATAITSTLAAGVIGGLLFAVLRRIDPSFAQGHAALDNALYKASFAALAVAVAMTATLFARRAIPDRGRFAGQATLWVAASLVVSWSTPGGSFLFLWPALFFAVAVGFWPVSSAAPARQALTALPLALSMIVVALVWVPTLVAAYQALTLALTPVIAGLIAMVACTAAVPAAIAAGSRAGLIPIVSLALSLVFAAIA
jgi:hypothetical protein